MRGAKYEIVGRTKAEPRTSPAWNVCVATPHYDWGPHQKWPGTVNQLIAESSSGWKCSKILLFLKRRSRLELDAKMSQPPSKRSSNTSISSLSNTPSKKVSAEWYQAYQSEAFVHNTEFDAAKIHTHSYSVKIGHLKGA